jgi:hypothetical protein
MTPHRLASLGTSPLLRRGEERSVSDRRFPGKGTIP